MRLLGSGVTALLAALVVITGLRLWVVEPVGVAGRSMAPTLASGQQVLSVRWGAADHVWQRGEVVVVRPAQGPDLVKRIVGLGGDRVEIRDGRLYVNRKRVHESWSDPEHIDSVFFGPVSVPGGQVFLLGDNRFESTDSRDFGPVSTHRIVGRVAAVVWPPSAWGEVAS